MRAEGEIYVADGQEGFEYRVSLIDEHGNAVDSFDSLHECFQGIHLTKEEAREALEEIIEDVKNGKAKDWFDVEEEVLSGTMAEKLINDLPNNGDGIDMLIDRGARIVSERDVEKGKQMILEFPDGSQIKALTGNPSWDWSVNFYIVPTRKVTILKKDRYQYEDDRQVFVEFDGNGGYITSSTPDVDASRFSMSEDGIWVSLAAFEENSEGDLVLFL